MLCDVPTSDSSVNIIICVNCMFGVHHDSRELCGSFFFAIGNFLIVK